MEGSIKKDPSKNTQGAPTAVTNAVDTKLAEVEAADLAQAQAGAQATTDLGLDNISGVVSTDPLAGFDPTNNISDITDENLENLEKSSRANSLRDLQDLLGAQFDDLAPLLEAEATRRGESEISADMFGDILKNSLSTNATATPEQLAAIDNIANQNIARSSSDLNRSLTAGLESLREEAGASRGLRFTDTPIFDEAQNSVNEMQRLQAQAISTARGAQSEAELNLPMAMQQLEFQRAGLATNAQSFQEQLAQQAFNNRTLLLDNTQNFGLNLMNSVPGALDSAFNADRLALDNRIRKDNNQNAQDNRKAGVIGGIASLVSDKNKKQDINTMTVPELKEAFKTIDISTWSYQPEHGLGTDTHIGPMAQDIQRVFGVGDGKTIEPVDQLGIMIAVAKVIATTGEL